MTFLVERKFWCPVIKGNLLKELLRSLDPNSWYLTVLIINKLFFFSQVGNFLTIFFLFHAIYPCFEWFFWVKMYFYISGTFSMLREICTKFNLGCFCLEGIQWYYLEHVTMPGLVLQGHVKILSLYYRGWSVCHGRTFLKTWEKNCLLKVISNIYVALFVLCWRVSSALLKLIKVWLMWFVTKNRMDKIFSSRTEEIEIGFLTILYFFLISI